jgi:hypothetical protein
VCASIAADQPIPLTFKRPDAPFELESVILRCLEKDADQRYIDVADLVLALAPILPNEATGSIARIVRVLRGQGATLPPHVSLRPPTPSMPARGSRPFLPGMGLGLGSPSMPPSDQTLFIEPSDQRRSGVGTKLRIRPSSPSREAAETMTAETSMSSEPPGPVGSSWRKNAVVGGFAFLAATVVLMWIVRSQNPVSSWVAPAPAAQSRSEASPSPAATTDPTVPMSIEFVDVPAVPAPSASASHPPSKRAAAGAKPAPGKSGGGVGRTPEPSGTAAFGSARD